MKEWTTNIKAGDFIHHKTSSTAIRKILLVCDNIVFVSVCGDFDTFSMTLTKHTLGIWFRPAPQPDGCVNYDEDD